MKKNLECKVTVKNGVRYYVDVSSNTCVDIICDDENAEEVCFDCIQSIQKNKGRKNKKGNSGKLSVNRA